MVTLEPMTDDLPENWSVGQTVSVNGTNVGLTSQHGYNYLMRLVNKLVRSVKTIAGGIDNSQTVTIAPGDWQTGTYPILVTGLTLSGNLRVNVLQPTPATANAVQVQQAALSLAGIRVDDSTAGRVTLVCSGTVPHITIRVKVEVISL